MYTMMISYLNLTAIKPHGLFLNLILDAHSAKILATRGNVIVVHVLYVDRKLEIK
jgi:hypothetical protein